MFQYRPSDWSDKELVSAVWKFFDGETVAHAVAIFSYAGMMWLFISIGVFSAYSPYFLVYFYSLLTINILALRHARHVSAMREFLTRLSADLDEPRLNECIPLQGRLGRVLQKTYELITSLVCIAALALACGWMLWDFLMSPAI